MTSLHILSGGAAQGLVSQLQESFQSQNGCTLVGNYGAVGIMRERFLAGEPCDVLILTRAQIEQLTQSGQVLSGSARSLGKVKTGVAVRAGEPWPVVGTPAELKAAMLASAGIYFPDPVKATAGIHFMNVLKQLGIDTQVASRLRPYPNGATAMRALSEANEKNLIGCTQVTEILYTPGVKLVAPLPKEFELATDYVAAVSAQAAQPQTAAALVDLLTHPQVASLRQAGGFE
jgi:molybdate transport system substrate-binding protein